MQAVTALLAVLRIIWPSLVGGVAIAGVTGWAVHSLDNARYEHLQNTYLGYQKDVAEANAQAQKAARDALQDQIDKAHTTNVRNQGIVDDLQKRIATAESDNALTQRLLATARQAAAKSASHSVPQTPGVGGTSNASEAPGIGRLIQLTSSALTECRANAMQLNALLDELKPQL